MGLDWGAIAAVLGAAGGTGWLGNVALETLRSRGKKRELEADIDLRIETHRDALTFQLLEAARHELKGLRSEVSRLRPFESYLLFFEQALNYIEVLLGPCGDDRKNIERDARAFLVRMRRRQSALGTMANEEQVAISQEEINKRGKPS